MNITHTTEVESNPLYIRMRQRFDFSGNRTIGEFMTMKAVREGFRQEEMRAPVSAHAAVRGSLFTGKRAIVSVAALLLSCILFVFCAVHMLDAVLPSGTQPAPGNSDAVMVNTLNDASVVRIVFPTDSSDTTME